MHALIVSEQGVCVRAEGDLLVVERGTSRLRQARVNDIEQVVLLGRVEIRSAAIALLLRRGIDLVFLTQQGTYRGRLAGRTSRNVNLRLLQYRRSADPGFCLTIARQIVVAKIRHQRQVLLRAQRQLHDSELGQALGSLRLAIRRAAAASLLDELRGQEGHAAALYFGQFGKLLRNADFCFEHRNRRPPRDPVNALLSFGYAVLGSLIETDTYRCGLDPMLGFLHQADYGRASLMLDVLELFRPFVDTLVLRIINRRQIGCGDFVRQTAQSVEEILRDEFADEAAADQPEIAQHTGDNGEPNGSGFAVLLSDTGRRIFLHELFRRMREKLFYPPRAGSFELRDIVREQLYHLSRVIEGSEVDFHPFVPT